MRCAATLICLAAVTLTSAAALACTCDERSRADAVKHAPHIFFGEVEQIAKVGDANVATVRVVVRYKGLTKKTKQVTVSTSRFAGDCGMLFEVGQRRLFYASPTGGKATELSTTTCAGTRVMTFPPLSLLTFSIGDELTSLDTKAARAKHRKHRADFLREADKLVGDAARVCWRVRSLKQLGTIKLAGEAHPNGKIELSQLAAERPGKSAHLSGFNACLQRQFSAGRMRGFAGNRFGVVLHYATTVRRGALQLQRTHTEFRGHRHSGTKRPEPRVVKTQ